MKEKLLFKTLSGSRLYGTYNENSDLDYKGVFLPDKEDLLLGKAPKVYQKSTASDNQRNTKDDVDETYYSLHYFLELLASGETNALDLFFANTNKEAIIYEDPIWVQLTKNADKLITKNINRYLGFCRSQAIKYSVKGEKLDAYVKFQKFLEEKVNSNTKDKNGNWVSLEQIFPVIATGLFVDYSKGDKVIGKRAPLLDNKFGDHAYILEMSNKEKYLMISDILFNFADTIVVNLHKVNRTISQYGKRAEIAKSENGADHKALSHAVRVLFQAEELLTTGKIEFPLKGDKLVFIKSIKFNQTNMTYQEIVDYIDNKIQYINEKLLPESGLRNSADSNFIKEFILKQY